MTWRRALADWQALDQRRPVAWWLGLSGTIAGALTLAALELQRAAPRGPARWVLLAALVLAVVIVGRRVFWNDTERRLRLPWRIVGFMLVAGLLGAALSALGLPRGGREGVGALVFALRALVTTTVAVIVAVRVFDRRPVRELGIVPGPGFRGDLGFGLALGAALMTLVFTVEWLAGWVSVEGFGDVRLRRSRLIPLVVGMAVISVCVGFYEELLSRGYLLRTMAQGFAGRRLGVNGAFVLAVLVSSAIFGLGHAGNPNASVVSVVNIVLAGVMLALPYVLTGRLAASIGLHTTWNFFQSAVYGFPTSGFAPPGSVIAITQGGPDGWTGGAFGPEGGALGLIAMLLGSAAFVWRERRRSGRVAPSAALLGPAPPLRPETPGSPSASRAGPAWSGGD